ncbi:MAG: hypothetical protein DELT_01934 [Desulfovibrio sp.]
MGKSENYIARKIGRFFDFSDVFVSIGMIALVLKFWMYPTSEDVADIKTFGVLMAFEFIMVHSGVFMLFASSMFSPWVALGVFFPVYGLFAYAFNAIAGNNVVMWTYLFVVAWRMRFAFSRPDHLVAMQAFAIAFFKAFVYFGALVLSSLVLENVFPYFGLTPEFAEATKLGGKNFFSTPHALMGFAFLYYAGLAIFDYWLTKDISRLATPA